MQHIYKTVLILTRGATVDIMLQQSRTLYSTQTPHVMANSEMKCMCRILHTHTHTHTHIYIYIHTHIHTHTYLHFIVMSIHVKHLVTAAATTELSIIQMVCSIIIVDINT